MKSYLKDIIIDLQKSGLWKIQLTIAIKFIISSKDTNEERIIHLKSDNMEILYVNANEAIEELFESLLSRYQTRLETSIRGSNFTFDSVNLLY